MPRYTPPFESGRPSEQYPLLMSTGRHESAFRISENRQNPYLLELAPRAYLYINPATAEQLGISDGMRVRVQSSAGSAFAYARFTFGMAQGVVQGVSGWWGEYNINKTVPWDGFAQGMGTWRFRRLKGRAQSRAATIFPSCASIAATPRVPRRARVERSSAARQGNN